MVTTNITLLVELGLFLFFLWGTAVFVIRPVLRSLDEREAALAAEREAAERANDEAQHLEERYHAQASRMRIEAEERFQIERQRIARETADVVSTKRRAADGRVLGARTWAEEHLQNQEGAIREQAPGVAKLIRDQLGARR